MPATPVMRMGLELKIAWPRAMALRGSRRGREDQASERLKTSGEKRPSPGVESPPGCSKAGTSAFTLELMVMKNGWTASGRGPPEAPSLFNKPTELLKAWALV